MTVEMTIIGLHCEHCSAKLEKALLAVEGVTSAKVNHEDGSAVVECDGKLSRRAWEKVVKEAGFKADRVRV